MSIYTVSQLNNEMKLLLETHPRFRNLFVKGEISNFKFHTSGHCYFSLKDRDAAVSCVMFRSDAQRLKFRPENGLSVIARGRISTYPKTGQVQLYASDLVPEGVGALSLQFEQLKEKLYREGLFDPGHKKQLPVYPATVALITSPTGAAVHDMIRILGRRFPCAGILVYPALVQGADAPASLIRALQRADRDGEADVLIIGRGGGSAEDLWAFNDEGLARAIFAARTPVVSAVGHEPDVTITDFVADVRAATPSAAAELVTPDADEMRQLIDHELARGSSALLRMLVRRKEHLSRAQRSLSLHTPERRIADLRNTVTTKRWHLFDLTGRRLEKFRSELEKKHEKLNYLTRQMLDGKSRDLALKAAELDSLSPLRVLTRGYTAAFHENGDAVTSIRTVREEENLQLYFHDGQADVVVKKLIIDEV